MVGDWIMMNPQEVETLGLRTKEGIQSLYRQLKPRRSIALLADLHVGAVNSLALPTYTTTRGVEVQASDFSIEIYSCWRHFWQVAEWARVKEVCLLGDLISGTIKAPKNIDFLPEVDEQKEMAIALLATHTRGKECYVIDGSGFHDSLDARLHHEIAQRLGGKYFPEGYFILREGDMAVLLAHNIRSSALYPAGIMEREAIFTAYGMKAGALPDIKLVVGAHWHLWSEVYRGGITYLVIPGWQGYYSYRGRMTGFGIRQPNIGGVILFINSSGFTTVPFLYPSTLR